MRALLPIPRRDFPQKGAPAGIAQGFSNGKDILVSAPRLVDENDLIRDNCGASLRAVTKAWALSRAGMMPSRRITSFNASRISASGGFDAYAADLVQIGQDGPHTNIVQASGHGMRWLHLPLSVLQAGFVALRHPWAANVLGETGSVLPRMEPQAPGFDANEFHLGVVEKTGKIPEAFEPPPTQA